MSDLRKNAKGLLKLFRIVPVLAWGISAVTLGVGLALYRTGWNSLRISYLFLLIFIVSMFQGLASHAINDVYDWCSGTDQHSKGILSGGTSVIKNKMLDVNQLKVIAGVALVLGIGGGLYLVWVRGIFILALLVIGIWSTIAYTMPPVQLAYRPLVGEWLGAWPAMAACTWGTFFVLTGTLTPYATAGGVLHATFSVAWLMQHHLPDIEADLLASPRKVTTVAFVSLKWGKIYTRYLVMGYFFLLALMGLCFGLLYNRAFLISVVFGFVCIWLAHNTNTSNIEHITLRQVGMIALSIGHAFSLALVFAFRLF